MLVVLYEFLKQYNTIALKETEVFAHLYFQHVIIRKDNGAI